MFYVKIISRRLVCRILNSQSFRTMLKNGCLSPIRFRYLQIFLLEGLFNLLNDKYFTDVYQLTSYTYVMYLLFLNMNVYNNWWMIDFFGCPIRTFH